MKFVAKFKCENGHEQEIKYGEGFSRQYVEDHCALMFGGRLHSIDKVMPGQSCAWSEKDGPGCGAKVTWTVEDAP